jgi:hypothetical protein
MVTEQLVNLSYSNHATNKTAYIQMSVTPVAARNRARLWCTFMTSNAGRGVLYTLGEWTNERDQWGTFEQCEVLTGPELVGVFTVRAVTR